MDTAGWIAEIWRDFNVVLGIFAIYFVARRHAEYRHAWNDQERAFSRAVLVLILAVLVAQAFGAYANFPFSIGVPLVTIGFVFLVSATVRTPDRFRDTEPDHLVARLRSRWRARNQTPV